MRNIDRFAGVPLCWLFSLISSLFPQRELRAVRKVLIIKFFGMGSIIVASPAFAMLKSRFPDARIDVLTFDGNKDLVERYPQVSSVPAIRTASLMMFLSDTFRVARLIRRERYDAVLDFEFFSKFSTLLSGFTGAPHRSGFALPARWRSSILTHQVELDKHAHVRESFCAQIVPLTGTRDIPDTAAPSIRPEDMLSMNRKLPLNGKPVIAINVNASDTFLERRWLPERFADLVSRLGNLHDWVFFFIGVDNERSYVQDVIDATTCRKRCYNVAGILTVPELAAFLRRCDLLLTADSGPAHLAAALGTPVVSLYGPESPEFYGPSGKNSVTLYRATPCSPCMNVYTSKTYKCPHNAACMREIHTSDVLEIVQSVMVQA
ncbi:MAG TPA: glycosyltransferase family 9 protein [Bacteroidota bacterium]|nr:glycosyltransferase family 9 protein [Bacteroidota bacterium]